MREAEESLIEEVVGRAIEVHRTLGPGLQESIYECALQHELLTHGIKCERQVGIDVSYKGVALGMGFRVDLLVEACLPLELKAVEHLTDVHRAQLISYLKLLQLKRGLLLNFNSVLLKSGIKRVSI